MMGGETACNMHPPISVGVLKWTRLCIQAESGHFETFSVNTL
jgi:hypothetical protein